MDNTIAQDKPANVQSRKPYEKPALTEVSLIKEVNALATCKSAGYTGPSGTGCKNGVNSCRVVG